MSGRLHGFLRAREVGTRRAAVRSRFAARWQVAPHCSSAPASLVAIVGVAMKVPRRICTRTVCETPAARASARTVHGAAARAARISPARFARTASNLEALPLARKSDLARLRGNAPESIMKTLLSVAMFAAVLVACKDATAPKVKIDPPAMIHVVNRSGQEFNIWQ